MGITLMFLGLQVSFAVTDDDDKKNNNKAPIGCTDMGAKYYMRVLELIPAESAGVQSMYFVFNKLKQPIHLYHMRYNDSVYSMRLNNRINAEQWGVLATGEKLVRYICTVDDKKSVYGRVVDCETSLKVCEYPKVKFGLNNTGNYWIVDSTTRNSAVHAVVRYGIIPGY